MIVIFDKSSRDWVLSLFNKSVDSEGFIAEKNNTRVWTQDGDEIKADDLAIIKKGSVKFIPGDLPSLMRESKGEL